MDFKTVHENRGYVSSLRKGKAKCSACGETFEYSHESLTSLSNSGFYEGHFKSNWKYDEILSVSGLSSAVFREGSGAAPLMNSSSRKKMG